jgi:hypothetical protein
LAARSALGFASSVLELGPLPPHGAHSTPPAPRLFDEVRRTRRLQRMSPRTERACVGSLRRYLRFHGPRHPRGMGAAEITAFVSHLAACPSGAASVDGRSGFADRDRDGAADPDGTRPAGLSADASCIP